MQPFRLMWWQFRLAPTNVTNPNIPSLHHKMMVIMILLWDTNAHAFTILFFQSLSIKSHHLHQLLHPSTYIYHENWRNSLWNFNYLIKILVIFIFATSAGASSLPVILRCMCSQGPSQVCCCCKCWLHSVLAMLQFRASQTRNTRWAARNPQRAFWVTEYLCIYCGTPPPPGKVSTVTRAMEEI